jgi:GTP cyclohydrolase II
VTERVPTGVHLSATNARYLATKALRGAHTLDVPLAGTHAQWLAGDAIAL